MEKETGEEQEYIVVEKPQRKMTRRRASADVHVTIEVRNTHPVDVRQCRVLRVWAYASMPVGEEHRAIPAKAPLWCVCQQTERGWVPITHRWTRPEAIAQAKRLLIADQAASEARRATEQPLQRRGSGE